MHFSTFLLSALAMVASAAPTNPRVNLGNTVDASDAVEKVSTYFNLLASKVQYARVLNNAPVCDLSRAQIPVAPEALPPVAPGLQVHHVAVGRGTQNYTCDTSNSTAVPAATGAVAVLFNVSCIAALYPDLLEAIPGMAIHFDVTDALQLGPASIEPSGVHYFTNGTTAFFDLKTDENDFGHFSGVRLNGTAAPTAAATGLGGERAVPWLKLGAIEGTTENMKEVYRVNTAGGSAPATCAGMPSTFEVQYATVYWFFQGDL
ncbi:hypothetical protein S40285_05276 [Stachybotrys chlorohalonatus IBT 40285]|uniref:Malate dehydrogenase n=1 Tax=Stachybotrys chlorohalonatus (strain IBT 40285) TaxID=1283841 RepID=A0A084QL86_STAC4|nr:hypothetical protein S40285_05276 [Stachybotrys chlorohalonata IBT 40285]